MEPMCSTVRATEAQGGVLLQLCQWLICAACTHIKHVQEYENANVACCNIMSSNASSVAVPLALR